MIEPERIESYIAAGGYRALYHALREMTPAAGRRGDHAERPARAAAGPGYPTGLKWATVAKQPADAQVRRLQRRRGRPRRLHGPQRPRKRPAPRPRRDGHRRLRRRGQPGLHLRPRRVPAGHPPAGSRHQAGEEARPARQPDLRVAARFPDRHPDRRRGLRLRRGDGADRTRSRASAACRRPRPPYPAEGPLGRPDADQQRRDLRQHRRRSSARAATGSPSIGTEKSKGTKVFALAGKIRNTGLVEVPMGTHAPRDRRGHRRRRRPRGTIKAVQTGGPSGGCIPAELLDTPVDYESLSRLGSIMGSGGMIVMDQTTNMVDVARFFMEFCMDESCGKCIPCRAGTVQMHRLLQRISQGQRHPPRHGAARGAVRHGQAHQPVRPRASRRRTRC